MKKIIFMLAFVLMSNLAFAKNDVSDVIIEKEKVSIGTDFLLFSTSTNSIEVQIVLGNKFRDCTFSYTLYFHNTVTGERYSRNYSHTTDSQSDSECRAQAKMHARVHAMFMQAEMNQ